MDKNELKKTALEFLKSNTTVVVATIAADGKPQAATVNYFIDDDFNFYFATRTNTRKFKNLAANKNIALVVGTGPDPKTLQMNGVAEQITDGVVAAAFKMLKENLLKKSAFRPWFEIPGIDFAIFKVTVNWMRWFDLDTEDSKEVYHQIIP